MSWQFIGRFRFCITKPKKIIFLCLDDFFVRRSPRCPCPTLISSCLSSSAHDTLNKSVAEYEGKLKLLRPISYKTGKNIYSKLTREKWKAFQIDGVDSDKRDENGFPRKNDCHFFIIFSVDLSDAEWFNFTSNTTVFRQSKLYDCLTTWNFSAVNSEIVSFRAVWKKGKKGKKRGKTKKPKKKTIRESQSRIRKPRRISRTRSSWKPATPTFSLCGKTYNKTNFAISHFFLHSNRNRNRVNYNHCFICDFPFGFSFLFPRCNFDDTCFGFVSLFEFDFSNLGILWNDEIRTGQECRDCEGALSRPPGIRHPR